MSLVVVRNVNSYYEVALLHGESGALAGSFMDMRYFLTKIPARRVFPDNVSTSRFDPVLARVAGVVKGEKTGRFSGCKSQFRRTGDG